MATQSATVNDDINSISKEDASRQQNEVKDIVRDFLNRSTSAGDDGLRAAGEFYSESGKLYDDISRKVVNSIQAADDDPKFIERITISGCTMAQTVYPHTSLEHQYYIALYTVCFFYVDDLTHRHAEAVAQFSRRFATGEGQLNPALDVFAVLLRQAYELWPLVGADSIIAGTLEGITACYVEHTTANMGVTPRATWWPNYFRVKTGFGPPYAHFNFMKGWGSNTPGSYIQLLPYLEFFLAGGNDILSFYKEQLAGEKTNYMHIRAATDETTVINTLSLLADETLACMQKIELLIGENSELMELWKSFWQGYLVWHVKTARYRLADLALFTGKNV